MTPEEFDAYFDSFIATTFRMETLQTYAVSEEDAPMHAFRNGLPRPERSVRTSPWLARMAQTTIAGKSWSRVHLIREPLSEYLRYELNGYRESAACGEEIRLVDLDLHPDLVDVDVDYWHFDRGLDTECVVFLKYNDDGTLRDMVRSTNSEYLAWCADKRDMAWVASVSLAEYLAKQPALP